MSFVHRWAPGGSPVALLLHGTGGDENDLIPVGRWVAPGAAILSPRGQVLENGAPRFFRRLSEGVFDLPDLHQRTAELAAFLEQAAEQYGFAPGSAFAIGYSNGANIAASLLLSHPEALAGAVLFRAMVPFEPEKLPDLTGKPLLLSAGRRDPIVPIGNTERLAGMLERAGARVTRHWQGAGHHLEREELDFAAAWWEENARA
jgi:predicted esterase